MHAAAGRHDRAVELAWRHFEDRPDVETYAGLLRRAEAAGDRARWRTRAHERLRERAEARRAQARASRFGWQRALADHSQLVRILLWEGELDAAWQEACQGRCSEDLWLTLAERRAADHPEDAVSAYRRLVPVAIGRKTKRDYRDAVELIERIGELLARLGRTPEFEEYVEQIRDEHKRKRSLMGLRRACRAARPRRAKSPTSRGKRHNGCRRDVPKPAAPCQGTRDRLAGQGARQPRSPAVRGSDRRAFLRRPRRRRADPPAANRPRLAQAPRPRATDRAPSARSPASAPGGRAPGGRTAVARSRAPAVALPGPRSARR
jgi:hypothetical protein